MAQSRSPQPSPALKSAGDDPMRIFNRRQLALHRARAAKGFSAHSFLKRAAAEDIALRLSAINRRFARVLDLGAHGGTLGDVLSTDPEIAPRIGEIFTADLSPSLLKPPLAVVCEEEVLPFAEASFDLVVSALSLHWVNDLPGALIQIRKALKPDGLFIGIALGGRTLNELRQSLIAAEEEIRGGAARSEERR